MQGFLVENTRVIQAFSPKDIVSAGVNGIWVNMANYSKVQVALITGAWAGGTSAVTIEQATVSTGGDAKALAFTFRYVSLGGQTAGNDAITKTAVTSNTFTLGTANQVNQVEILATDLDINNGFKFVRVVLATPGANADLVAGAYILYDADYAMTPANLPTGIQ